MVMTLAIAPAARADRVGTQFLVAENLGGLPAVAMGAGGDFVVAWGRDGAGSTKKVFARHFDDTGAPLGPEFQVSEQTTGRQYLPGVAATPDGGFIVVWWSTDGADFDVLARRYDATDTPLGGEFVVNDYTTGDQTGSAVTVDASGRFVIVWSGEGPGDPQGVFARRYDAAGAPQGSGFLVNSDTVQSGGGAALASTPAGDFTVVWQGDDAYTSGIFGRRFDVDGVPQGAEFPVNSVTDGSDFGPRIAMADSGESMVVWWRAVAPFPDYDVFGRVLDDAGSPLGPEVVVPSYFGGRQDGVEVAADADGGFMVTWEDTDGQDGDRGGVFGKRVDAIGADAGPEFQVNADAMQNQGSPAVGSNGAGDAVVVWSGEGLGTAGVFGQLYGPDCGDEVGDPPCIDQPIDATKLVLKGSGTDGKIAFVSKDPTTFVPVPGGEDDPRLRGATLTIVSPLEPPVHFFVPATSTLWKAKSGLITSYSFGARTFAEQETVRRLKVRQGKSLKMRVKQAGLALAAPQGQVGIRLTIGDRRTCALFDAATVLRDEPGRFVAKGATHASLADCSDAALGAP
jgi:hypothetical protein